MDLFYEMTKLFQIAPEQVANCFPDWAANCQTEFMIRHNPDWMERNYPEMMDKHRLDKQSQTDNEDIIGEDDTHKKAMSDAEWLIYQYNKRKNK